MTEVGSAKTEAPRFSRFPEQQLIDGQPFPLLLEAPAPAISLARSIFWLRQHQAFLEDALSVSGALLFRGFPVRSAQDFDAFSAAFGYADFTYQESLSNAVRLNHTTRVFTANEAPPEVEIYLHHEMAQTPVSPAHLFFFCLSPALQGGATSLCRSDQLYQRLLQAEPDWAWQFASRGLCYTTRMPEENDASSGQGRSWKSTLSVADRPAAETKLRSLGYAWQWQADGSLRATTPVLPAVITLADGRQAFYNQLIAAYRGWAGVKQDPGSALTFGDGEPVPASLLDRLADWADALSFDLDWQAGDVALIDNRTTMHGRRPYSGGQKRQVLVALAASQANRG